MYDIGKITVAPRAILDFLSNRVALEICRKEFQEVVRCAMQQTWTRDPFDRMITAQAALEESALITKDRFISSHYPRAIW